MAQHTSSLHRALRTGFLQLFFLLGILAVPSFALAAAGDLDTSFNPGVGLNGYANTSAVQADDKIIIGGSFTTVNGVVRNYIARLNTDGSVDSSFNPGTGASNAVWTLALQADGKVIIGGFFTSVNSVARSRIARLNADGSLDASFNPGTGASSTVRAIALQADGKILIGGEFTTVNGTARNYIARLNSDGSLDASFNPGGGASNYIYALALQPDGKILIGGIFGTVQVVGRARIARLNANGTLDTNFNPGSGTDNGVSAFALQGDGKILIGGAFTTVNGVARKRIARLNTDGSVDGSFNPGTGANSDVGAIAPQADGKIIIGGYFITVNGVARNYIARLNADGSLDTSFNPGTGANYFVLTIALQANGKIIIGGWFTTVNGVALNRIARIHTGDSDGDGIQDAADKFSLDPAEWVDTDLDGIGNNADLDDDGDSVPDYIDAAPLNAANSAEILLPLNNAYKGSQLRDSSGVQ